MEVDSDSKEESISQSDSKAAQPIAAPKIKRKKTVVGIGPGQPPLPPIPTAVKEADRAKDAKVPRSPKSVEEKPSQTRKPDVPKPAEPEAFADTLFSGISAIPSVSSKPTASAESKGESVEKQPVVSPSPLPEPSKQLSVDVDAASSIRPPPKRNTMRAVALWSGVGLVFVGALIALAAVGLNLSTSERSTITVVQERIDRADNEPTAAQPQQRSIETVTVKPEPEKEQAERVQPKQTEQPKEPPEQVAIQKQEAESIELPKEASRPESVQAAAEKKPERASDIREMLERGKSRLRRGDLDQAEASFREVLDHDPNEHHAMEGLVKILIKRGQAREALTYCERMVKKRPRRARYRILYGDTLAMTGNKQAAREQYSEALRYSPDDKEAKRRLAQSQ